MATKNTGRLNAQGRASNSSPALDARHVITKSSCFLPDPVECCHNIIDRFSVVLYPPVSPPLDDFKISLF